MELERACFVEWIFYIYFKHAPSSTPAVPFRAAKVYDAFIQKTKPENDDYFLYAFVSLWISLKYSDEDHYVYSWKNILKSLGYSKKRFFEAEKQVFFSSMDALISDTAVDCSLFRIEEIGERGLKRFILCGEACLILFPEMDQKEVSTLLSDYAYFLEAYKKDNTICFDTKFKMINHLYFKLRQKYHHHIKTHYIHTCSF
jgi:hypothetical protein